MIIFIYFYYTFHHEGLHYDYIELVIILKLISHKGLIILLLLEYTLGITILIYYFP